MPRPQEDVDPLALAIAPPPDETLEQRLVREAAEAEAKRISDEIDEQLKREKENERKKRKPVKLLLLGPFFVFSPFIVPTYGCTNVKLYHTQVKVKVAKPLHSRVRRYTPITA